MLQGSLARTSSAASVSSGDEHSVPAIGIPARRTRKRFTSNQLTLLENAFHRNSHPSRDERDALARLGGMETKSVTIWFQNKRQMERKVALNNGNGISTVSPIARSCSNSGSNIGNAASSARPSLDSVASRTELRSPPRRHHEPAGPLSPVTPVSPPPLDMSMSRRVPTLEWACAAARQSDRNAAKSRRRARRERERHESTDEDTDELVTPSGSLSAEDIKWTTQPDGRLMSLSDNLQDEDMMKAALTLCGLGRHARS